MCAVVVTGVARSNTWRLRIAAKSSIASGAPLRFWGGGLGVLLALGVWYSTAGASVRMVGAGRGGGPCATAGRIFSARFESSRVLTGFVLLFCFFVQVFVAGGAAWQPLQAVRIVWPLPAGVLCAFALASCAAAEARHERESYVGGCPGCVHPHPICIKRAAEHDRRAQVQL